MCKSSTENAGSKQTHRCSTAQMPATASTSPEMNTRRGWMVASPTVSASWQGRTVTLFSSPTPDSTKRSMLPTLASMPARCTVHKHQQQPQHTIAHAARMATDTHSQRQRRSQGARTAAWCCPL